MKSKVIFLIGPPLSGKDTFIQNNQFGDFIVISRDNILLSLMPGVDYTTAFNTVDQKKVDKILNNNISEAIQKSKNIIINMTNLTKKSRNRNLCKFPKDKYETQAIVFPKLDLSEYLYRNKKRTEEQNKFIPPSVIMSMIQNWEEINSSEGFDTIIKL